MGDNICFKFDFNLKVVRPVSALIIVDVQNDFISGSLAISNCPARHNGEEVRSIHSNHNIYIGYAIWIETYDARNIFLFYVIHRTLSYYILRFAQPHKFPLFSLFDLIQGQNK